MAKVRILPDRVANQIAAGEVIERPAAVVKELVENALDAGATRVEVEFRSAGRALIRVEDNGGGMARDDALLALERHGTSKIADAADLDRLHSYGFRGEALPSIASVSRFTLQTREAASDLGTEIVVNGGKLLHVRECGRAVGTRIEVAQLFHPVPARRKFLKTDATEAAHIIQSVRLYALACPQVAFTLIEDGRVVFRSPECSSVLARVTEIFGRQIAEGLVPLEASEAGLTLRGLVGRPGQGRPTRHELITFVNARPVDSRTLNYALIESYAESLPRGRYPVAFVFLELDPAAVDVNVHPAKREVRFRSEPQVRSFVIRAVLARLRELGEPGDAAGESSAGTVASRIGAERLVGSDGPTAPTAATAAAAATARASAAEPSFGGTRASRVTAVAPAPPPVAAPRVAVPLVLAPEGIATVAAPAPGAEVALPSVGVPARAPAGPGLPRRSAVDWRFVGLAHGTYALFETSSGLVLLDRKAALERVWFERLEAGWGSGPAESQRLLIPVTVELDPVGAALLLDQLEFLGRHGFEVVEFGRSFFRIEGVPACIEPGDAEACLREIVGALRDGSLAPRDPGLARAMLARMAASRAARSQPVNTPADFAALLAQLFACRQPHTNSAGRPTYIELGHGELARRFHRGG